MSLSCRGEMVINNGEVESVGYKGMPRERGEDSWLHYYKVYEKGDEITNEAIKKILSYKGKNNVVSVKEKM